MDERTSYRVGPLGQHVCESTPTNIDKRTHTYTFTTCPACGWWEAYMRTRGPRGAHHRTTYLLYCRCSLEHAG